MRVGVQVIFFSAWLLLRHFFDQFIQPLRYSLPLVSRNRAPGAPTAASSSSSADRVCLEFRLDEALFPAGPSYFVHGEKYQLKFAVVCTEGDGGGDDSAAAVATAGFSVFAAEPKGEAAAAATAGAGPKQTSLHSFFKPSSP